MSDMRPLPYYKWHWLEWRGSRTVQRMSYIERGLYRELLDECWSEGGIPEDIDALADICGCPSEVMASAWQVLSKCFEPSGNTLANGKQLLVNKRIENERTAKDKERVQKAINGRRGGSAKSLKSNKKQASAKQVLSNCHIEEKRREEKIYSSKRDATPEGFDDFWNAYGKKVGKQNAVKEWRKVSPDSELVALMIEKAKAYVIAKPEAQYRKDPERWIKGRHWEDDLAAEPVEDDMVTNWQRYV